MTEKIADRDHTTPIYLDNGIPIISPTNLNNDDELEREKIKYISEEAHLKNMKKTDIRPGDVIFSRIGAGLGKSFLIEDNFCNFSILHSLCMIRTNNKLDSGYLCWFLRSPYLQNRLWLGVQSIGVPDLGLKEIGHLPIAFPVDMKEQKMICNEFEKVRSLINLKKNYLSKLLFMKKGLMNDLLTGKVRVKV